ncbi:MAG: hypothetical protein R3A10_12185 [Caldilineaceae bacterium]
MEIPTDGVVVTAKDLFVSQSGVDRRDLSRGEDGGAGRRPGRSAGARNCLFAGTNVRSGSGSMLVVHNESDRLQPHCPQPASAPPETEVRAASAVSAISSSDMLC